MEIPSDNRAFIQVVGETAGVTVSTKRETGLKIRFYPPFHILGGDVIDIPIENEMTLHEFSHFLLKRFPRLLDFLPRGDKSIELLENIMFVANQAGKLLRPSDIVRDEDFLEIMAPLDGG